MICLHPCCPMLSTTGTAKWRSVVENSYLNLPPAQQAPTLTLLNRHFGKLGTIPAPVTLPISNAALKRLLELCPCLFTQIDEKPTAKAIVHLCEITLGKTIDCTNAHDAYLVQHPSAGPDYTFPPVRKYEGIGGSVIHTKHLLTLQEGVSEAQFNEMTESGIRLVVPEGLHNSYPETVRPHLITLEEFIGDVRLNC